MCFLEEGVWINLQVSAVDRVIHRRDTVACLPPSTSKINDPNLDTNFDTLFNFCSKGLWDKKLSNIKAVRISRNTSSRPALLDEKKWANPPLPSLPRTNQTLIQDRACEVSGVGGGEKQNWNKWQTCVLTLHVIAFLSSPTDVKFAMIYVCLALRCIKPFFTLISHRVILEPRL